MASIRRHLRNLFQLNKRYFLSRYRQKQAARIKSDDFYARLPEIIFEEAPCVFVLSTGRCGTMLLTRMLQKANNVDAYHTPDPELRYPSRLAYRHGMDDFEEYCTAAKCARYDLIEESVVADRVYAETNCKITFFAPHIRRVFEGSKFVHLVRHPVSFAQSAIERGYYQSARADRAHIFPVCAEKQSEWKTMSVVQKVAWNWNATNRYIEKFKDSSSDDRIQTIKSEELFSDVEKTCGLLEYCGAKGVTRDSISSLQGRRVNASHRPGRRVRDVGRDVRDRIRSEVPLADRYGYSI